MAPATRGVAAVVVLETSDVYSGSTKPVPISGRRAPPLWAAGMSQYLLLLKFGTLAVQEAAAAARKEVTDGAVGESPAAPGSNKRHRR